MEERGTHVEIINEEKVQVETYWGSRRVIGNGDPGMRSCSCQVWNGPYQGELCHEQGRS